MIPASLGFRLSGDLRIVSYLLFILSCAMGFAHVQQLRLLAGSEIAPAVAGEVIRSCALFVGSCHRDAP